MLTGYERFRDTFAPYKDSFVVIGGTAIEMLRGPNPRFPRTTKDIDMVVMTRASIPNSRRGSPRSLRRAATSATSPADALTSTASCVRSSRTIPISWRC